MQSSVPRDWPSAVSSPGGEDFEASAVAWLLDVLPYGYREQTTVRRYPVALAVVARHHTAACLEGAREGHRAIRSELGHLLPPAEIQAVLEAYQVEGAELAATARAVPLVKRTLRGEVFKPKR